LVTGEFPESFKKIGILCKIERVRSENCMHRKKYWLLLPPFLIVGILLIIYLPDNQNFWALCVPLGFWAVYYGWIYMEKKLKESSG
jgi:hypothetical protein